jgi:hypothetical protein
MIAATYIADTFDLLGSMRGRNLRRIEPIFIGEISRKDIGLGSHDSQIESM